MYQKDYILRIIEHLGKLIAGILGLIKKGELDPAREQLQDLYYEMLQHDAAFFNSISEAELTNKLLHEHNYTNGHIEILAELFNTEAELAIAGKNKPACLEYSRKSLILFKFIDTEYKTYSSDRLSKIDAIIARINSLS